jgi:glycosyltransferase involved in cell wall biosynthesis
MPCYNAAATLPQALHSLARQTLQAFELVIVDDGSTDGAPEILSSWAAGGLRPGLRLNLVYQPHAGIVPALRRGLAACCGDYVARMDTDDLCQPERLRLQRDYLDAHPDIDLVACRTGGFPQAGMRDGMRRYLDWQNALLNDADLRREMFVESPFVHPSVMFRRAAVERVGGYCEPGWAEDYDLWLRMYIAGSGFGRLPETLLLWRDRPERLTRTDPRYSLENFLRAKAFYLLQGPLKDRDPVFIWGAGTAGRRLGRELIRLGAPVQAYFDIDPRKVGGSRFGRRILAGEDLPGMWRAADRPALLAAVGTRGARPIVRARLAGFGLAEGADWWFAA